MKREFVEELLDSCLLTNDEFALGPDVWLEFENPFFDEIFANEEDEEEDEEEE